MFVNMGRVFQQNALRFADCPAVINVGRDRSFTYARTHELTNRLSNALKQRFGLGPGDFYATILDNDNMALFHPWMLKSPVGAVWIDVRDSLAEQDMIITGGYNVYAIEVENCLNSHPTVLNSAVVGIPHDIWGEAVCAMVMLIHGSKTSPQELIDHCKQHLARYKAPKKIELTDQLPLSPAGKVLRREVRRLLKDKDKHNVELYTA